MLINVNKNNINEVLNSDKKVLLDFYADWCSPCRLILPIVKKVAEENPQYVIGKINIDESPELAAEYGVSSIPTLIVLENGREIKRSLGAKPKPQILAMLEG
ncbi:MAG: thioredoxin [Clostridia bacterium]|nr:thioredoxin [Clostridia bacterium]